MNMQQSLLEAIHSVEEIDRLSPDQALAELKTYVFPMNAVKNIQSSAIRDMVDNNKPVTFLWAATEYVENGANRDPKFLFDLGRSLLPEENGKSLFFAHATQSEAKYNNRAYPFASKMVGGPIVFELFKLIVGSELSKLDNAFTTTFNDDGTSDTQRREDDTGLADAMGKYYQALDKEIEHKYSFVSQRTTSPEYSDFSDAVLYGAYIGCMFDVLNSAMKKTSASDGTKLKKLPHIANVFDYGARNVAEKAVGIITASSQGSLDNAGSIYNKRKSAMRIIEPSRLTNDNLSEIRVYPQYVVDVLKLTPDKNDKPGIGRFRKILTQCGYDGIAQALEGVTSVKDNAKIDVSPDELINALKDERVIKECNNDIPDIFTKSGNSWVDARGRSSLDSVLGMTPPKENADDQNSRAVAVGMEALTKRSNTDREFIGEKIIPTTHTKMQIGKAAVVKDLTTKTLNEELEKRKREGLSFEEYVEELKTASKNEFDLNKKDKLTQNINKAFRHTAPDAEAAIVFDLDDGQHHCYKVTDGLDERLATTDFGNVIVRKPNAGTYFLSIPHGIAFATMQDDDGNIVRNDNADTLCMGLYLNGDEVKYRDVNDLMNSPIGKYCHVVVSDGKTGRIRFSTDKANAVYGKVLNALKDMKSHGQSFNPPVVNNMNEAINWMAAILKINKIPATEIKDDLQAFVDKSLVLSVETYNTKTGKFFFRPINRTHRPTMAAKLIKHLSDMYNLDTTVDGYSADDVKNVLEVVVPKAQNSSDWRWDLSDWNYGNVLKADAALNGTSVNINVEELDAGEEVGGDEDANDVSQVFDDNYKNQTADNGDPDDTLTEDNEVSGEDIGGEYFKAINSAYENAFEKVFEDYDELPPTQQKALINDVKNTYNLQRQLANNLHSMWKNGEVEIDLAPDVNGIQFSNFNEFRTKFWDIVHKAEENKPDLADNSIRMRAFFGDDDDVLSAGGSVSEIKDILSAKLDTDDVVDKIFIPVIGSLMVQYSMDDAASKKDFDGVFDRERMISSFEANFNNTVQSKADELASLEDTVNSDENADTEEVLKKIAEAGKEYTLYQKIQQKIKSDPSYLSKVADFVMEKSADIIGNVNELPTDIDKSYSPFDGETVGTTAGNEILDFCTYNTEGTNISDNTRLLNEAFKDGNVHAMMNDLYMSVPKDCLSIDYGTDENGSRLGSKIARELFLNEVSTLKSHYAKSHLYKKFRALAKQIQDIYSEADPIHSLFGFEDGEDTSSPYAYMYDGKAVNLNDVKTFFDSLMVLADSYNLIGSTENTESQELVQQTVNNEIQKSKKLTNQHFKNLHASFTSFLNALNEHRKLTPDDLRDLKKVVNKVLNQVVSNPMNVLINNNAKLISAYAYYIEIVKANRRSISPSGNEYGFGTGNAGNDAAKEYDKENQLLGRNEHVNRAAPVLKVALRISHSQYIKNKIASSGVDINQALTDYKNYLDDFGYKGEVDAVDVVKRIKKDEDAGTLEDKIYIEKQKSNLFCNYGVDNNSTDAGDVAKLRTDELIALLYNTAAAIVNSRSKFGRFNPNDPNKAYNEFVSKISSQAQLLQNDNIEIIPERLLTTFKNLEAELLLADYAEFQKIIAAANKPTEIDPKSIQGNNDQMGKAIGQTLGLNSIPKNRADKLVDELLSDKENDTAEMQREIAAMGKAGNAEHDSSIKMNATLDVVYADANDMIIRPRTINLHDKDYITINGTNPPAERQVTKVVNGKADEFNILPVAGLKQGDKKIPFSRFQKRNTFGGTDFSSKLVPIVRKLNQWYNQYKGNDQTIPSIIINKLTWLKQLVNGSAESDMIKSIVSYLAWRVCHFDFSAKPEKLSFAGGEPKDEKLMTRIIMSDLKTFGPNGEMADEGVYNTIKSVLPDGFDRIASSQGYTVVTPKQTKEVGTTIKHNVQVSSLNLNAKMGVKKLVDFAAQYSNFVAVEDIQKLLSTPALYKHVFTDEQTADDDAKRWLDAIDEKTGKLRSTLVNIIKEHNWSIAKPLIDAYKRTDATPTFDGAIDYIGKNYDMKKVRNVQEFVNYIKANCANDVRYELQ